jgi:hypothetical protein
MTDDQRFALFNTMMDQSDAVLCDSFDDKPLRDRMIHAITQSDQASIVRFAIIEAMSPDDFRVFYLLAGSGLAKILNMRRDKRKAEAEDTP